MPYKTRCYDGAGSAMYTLQALWTQAREHLNVITIICDNSAYSILKVRQQVLIELENSRAFPEPEPVQAMCVSLQ